MLYIVTALKSEAQAFVDRYKLKKTKLNNHTLFIGSSVTLVISGIGVYNSKIATQSVLKNFNIEKDDIFLNIGICGGSKEYKIGQLLEIDAVSYKDKTFLINKRNIHTLTCVDEELSEERYKLADMESYGFFDAILKSSHVKHIYIFKVVSDNFEQLSITKELTKSLIFNAIDDINKIIFKEVK